MRPGPFVILLMIGSIFMLAIVGMPAFGDPEAPASQHIAPRYIERTYDETGVSNMVTGLLANYRAYDTFAELITIFTAGTGAVALLRRR